MSTQLNRRIGIFEVYFIFSLIEVNLGNLIVLWIKSYYVYSACDSLTFLFNYLLIFVLNLTEIVFHFRKIFNFFSLLYLILCLFLFFHYLNVVDFHLFLKVFGLWQFCVSPCYLGFLKKNFFPFNFLRLVLNTEQNLLSSRVIFIEAKTPLFFGFCLTIFLTESMLHTFSFDRRSLVYCSTNKIHPNFYIV